MNYRNFLKEKQLNIISNNKGNIMKYINSKDTYFKKFGEIYFSKISYKKIKCWKLHTKMQMNISVPIGKVLFVFKLENKDSFYTTYLGERYYKILNIKPGIWFGFQGLEKKNLVCNFANIPHKDKEVRKKNKNYFNFDGWK